MPKTLILNPLETKSTTSCNVCSYLEDICPSSCPRSKRKEVMDLLGKSFSETSKARLSDTPTTEEEVKQKVDYYSKRLLIMKERKARRRVERQVKQVLTMTVEEEMNTIEVEAYFNGM